MQVRHILTQPLGVLTHTLQPSHTNIYITKVRSTHSRRALVPCSPRDGFAHLLLSTFDARPIFGRRPMFTVHSWAASSGTIFLGSRCRMTQGPGKIRAHRDEGPTCTHSRFFLHEAHELGQGKPWSSCEYNMYDTAGARATCCVQLFFSSHFVCISVTMVLADFVSTPVLKFITTCMGGPVTMPPVENKRGRGRMAVYVESYLGTHQFNKYARIASPAARSGCSFIFGWMSLVSTLSASGSRVSKAGIGMAGMELRGMPNSFPGCELNAERCGTHICHLR